MTRPEPPNGIPRSYMDPLDKQTDPNRNNPLIPESFKVDLPALRSKRTPILEPITRSHVNWELFFRGGYHSLLHGKTGAGKTTLQIYLTWVLHNAGHRIIHRDDGNREFLYLAPHIPMIVWHPKDTRFELKAPHRYPNLEIRTFTEPGEILDAAYKTPQRYHAIMYDCYCLESGIQAKFYSEFFRDLIYKCMQGEWDDWDDDEDDAESDEYRAPLVASFDEINDLIPPKSKSPSKSHVDVLRQITVNIRKLRKYRVTLMASTHRFNQLDLDVRSQFSYYFIKKSYGQDIYQFMNTNLWTVNAQGYNAAMKFVTTMPQDQVLIARARLSPSCASFWYSCLRRCLLKESICCVSCFDLKTYRRGSKQEVIRNSLKQSWSVIQTIIIY